MTKLIRGPRKLTYHFKGVNPMTKSLIPSSLHGKPTCHSTSPISSFCWLLSCSSPVSCHHRLRSKCRHFSLCIVDAACLPLLLRISSNSRTLWGCPSCIPKTIQVCISRRKNVSELLWLFAHSVNMNSYQCGHTPEANNRFKDSTWKKCIHFMSKFQIHYQSTFRCNTGRPCPPPLIHQWKEHPRPLHLQHLPRKKKQAGGLAFAVGEYNPVDFSKIRAPTPELLVGLEYNQDIQHSRDSQTYFGRTISHGCAVIWCDLMISWAEC